MKLKDVEKMTYPELKHEAKGRGIFKVPMSFTELKRKITEHREANPDFEVPVTVPPTVSRVKSAEEEPTIGEVKVEGDKVVKKEAKTGKAVTKKEDKEEAAAKEEPKKAGKKGRQGTKIQEIISLYKEGKSYKEIEAKGYNITTVRIQCAKYDRENGKPESQKTEPKAAKAKVKKEAVKEVAAEVTPVETPEATTEEQK